MMQMDKATYASYTYTGPLKRKIQIQNDLFCSRKFLGNKNRRD